MRFELSHVFDFVNQADMLILHPRRPDSSIPNSYHWSFCSEIPEVNRIGDVPKLVSLKTSVDNDSSNGSPRYMMRVVFENGVFGQGPVAFHNDNISEAENRNQFNATTIDANGNIRFQGGRLASMIMLYNYCVQFLFGRGRRGPGMWENMIRFRR